MSASRKKKEPLNSYIAVCVIGWVIITLWMLGSRVIEYTENPDLRLAFEIWVMGTVAIVVFFAFALHEPEE